MYSEMEKKIDTGISEFQTILRGKTCLLHFKLLIPSNSVPILTDIHLVPTKEEHNNLKKVMFAHSPTLEQTLCSTEGSCHPSSNWFGNTW